MRKIFWSLVLALIVITSIAMPALWNGNKSYERRVVEIISAKKVDTNCPLNVQILDAMTPDELMVCSEYGVAAYIATTQYPPAIELFKIYGGDERFLQVFGRYGVDGLQVINYFRKNGSLLMRAEDSFSNIATEIKAWSGVSISLAKLKEDRFGFKAVLEIQTGGHTFLSEFIMKDSEASRLTSKQLLNFFEKLFAGGIITVETRFRRNESITPGEGAEAALNALIILGPITKVAKVFGILKEARVVTKGAELLKSGEQLTRSSEYVVKSLRLVGTVAGYTAPYAIAYAVIFHPSLLFHAGEVIGDVMRHAFGFPEWTGYGVMFLIVLFVLWPLIAGLWFVLSACRVTGWIARRMHQFFAWATRKTSPEDDVVPGNPGYIILGM